MIIFQTDDENVSNQLIDRIKGLGYLDRISDNAWCIRSYSKNTVDIRDSLKDLLTNNSERLMVLNISDCGFASCYVPRSVTAWLK